MNRENHAYSYTYNRYPITGHSDSGGLTLILCDITQAIELIKFIKVFALMNLKIVKDIQQVRLNVD